MPERGGPGRVKVIAVSKSNSRSSSIGLKLVRRLFGVDPTPKSSFSNRLASPWPFLHLETFMRLPEILSRTWYLENDFKDGWIDDYQISPRRSSRLNEQPSGNHPAETATERKSLEKLSPLTRPTAPSKHTPSTPTALAEGTAINGHRTPVSHQLPIIEREQQARFDVQFGPIGSHDHRYVSKHMGGELPVLVVDEAPYFYLITTYISYMILIAFGRIRDFFGKRFKSRNYKHLKAADGYAALNSDFDNFYFRRLKTRMNDCFSRPYETPFY
jgi:hypothetical protein